jgi:N-acetylmuramoyl-L-alanine amidase
MDDTPTQNLPPDEIEPEIEPKIRSKNWTYSIFRLVQTVISAAVVTATLFTLWNPHSLFASQNIVAFLPTPINLNQNGTTAPSSAHVGIQIGHYQHDEGNTCPDGIKEVDVDYIIANKVNLLLITAGVKVDMLDEYDLKLINYKADALISIHTGSCTDPSAAVSGFKIENSLKSGDVDKTNALATCLAEQYQQNTELTFGYQVVAEEDPENHTFMDINPQTPAVLIESGSLAVDRGIIIESSDRAANGITAGILCYLKNEKLIK